MALSAVACGGIDEPDLFAITDSGTSSGSDGGKADARADGSTTTKDSGTNTNADSGPILSGNVVACSDGPCPVGDNVCCVSSGTVGICEHAANCSGDLDLPVPCDDANDCAQLGHPGQLCCVQGDNSGNATSVTCRDASNCRADQGQTNLCDPAASNPCPNGGTCQASTSLPLYNICAQ